MLRALSNEIDLILSEDSELIIKLTNLKLILHNALSTDKFRLECVDTVLESIVSWNQANGLWNAPPLFTHADNTYSVRIVYWPAFYENNPHEHKTWGVTGILHNQLNIATYEMLDNPRRLKKNLNIIAGKNEVGFLVPGCIHNINNPTPDLSASLHIFNNLPGIKNSEENAIWYPAPRRHNLSLGLVDRALEVCLDIVSSIKSKQTQDLIEKIYTISDKKVKLQAISSLYSYDPIVAFEKMMHVNSQQPEMRIE